MLIETTTLSEARDESSTTILFKLSYINLSLTIEVDKVINDF